MSLIERLSQHYDQQLPFTSFRKPNSKELTAYLCHSNELELTETFKEQGFVFSPFDDRKASVIFKIESSDILSETIQDYDIHDSVFDGKSTSDSSDTHEELVRSGIRAIKSGKFRKVVLSRKETVELEGLDIIEIYKRLLVQYQNAFVYIWFHPTIGLWFGATPERLVSLENDQFVTMALAGTQLYKGQADPIWGEKEKIEHQYVVDYIVSQIKNPTNGIILKDFKVSDTYTSKAGNLLHLKADIQGEIGEFNLKELLKTLHPTPAVCGLPKEASKEFILKNESYDRKFYSGFLGEMNRNGKTELFVNLRCAEYDKKFLYIYVGGGITKDSDPHKEWLETIAKTKTILHVL